MTESFLNGFNACLHSIAWVAGFLCCSLFLTIIGAVFKSIFGRSRPEPQKQTAT